MEQSIHIQHGTFSGLVTITYYYADSLPGHSPDPPHDIKPVFEEAWVQDFEELGAEGADGAEIVSTTPTVKQLEKLEELAWGKLEELGWGKLEELGWEQGEF
jgi:hypothetical protein